jgi:hypothetical protein
MGGALFSAFRVGGFNSEVQSHDGEKQKNPFSECSLEGGNGLRRTERPGWLEVVSDGEVVLFPSLPHLTK